MAARHGLRTCSPLWTLGRWPDVCAVQCHLPESGPRRITCRTSISPFIRNWIASAGRPPYRGSRKEGRGHWWYRGSCRGARDGALQPWRSSRITSGNGPGSGRRVEILRSGVRASSRVSRAVRTCSSQAPKRGVQATTGVPISSPLTIPPSVIPQPRPLLTIPPMSLVTAD